MILAFETSTDVCSVAFQNKEGQIFEERITGKGVHSSYLFLFAEKLKNNHNFLFKDIETVLISNGPGSYTGLRIGASAIKGMLFGLNTSLYAVNTLAAIAASQLANTEVKRVHAVLDARRSHFYYQQFEIENEMIAKNEQQLIKTTDFESRLSNGDIIVGTGLNRLNVEGLKLQLLGIENISAVNIIKLFNNLPNANFFEKTTLEELNPNYITSNQINNAPVKS